MLIDGIQLAEGSEVSNLTVAIGSNFPSDATNGEFFLKSTSGVYNLYIYHSGAWNKVADEQTIQDTLGYTPVNKAGDTMSGALTLSGAPTLSLHAATKAYVDAATGTGSFTITGDVAGTIDGGTDVLTLAASGVTAGSYKQVQVNSKGLVTSGSNPTTVAGFGISDALTTAYVPTWASVTGKPTTLSGYGITDGLTPTVGDSKYVAKTYTISTPSNFTTMGSISLSSITGNKSRITATSSGWHTAKVETYKNAGKFVFEASNITSNGVGYVGFANIDTPVTGSPPIGQPTGQSRSFAVGVTTGALTSSHPNITVSGSAASASANVPYMLAVDLDAGKAWVCYNNVWANSGNPETGANPSFSWTPGSLSLAPAGTPNQQGQGGALDFNFGTTSFVNNVPAGYVAGWGVVSALGSVSSFNTRSGAVTLLNTDVTSALGYTPISSNQTITVSGDATGSGTTSLNLTLANSGVTAGSYGSATQSATYSVNSKGQLTLAGNVTITPAWASITSKPTTVAGYGITDAYTKSLSDSKYLIKTGELSAYATVAPNANITISGANSNVVTSAATGAWRGTKTNIFKSSGKFLFSGTSSGPKAQIGMALSAWTAETAGILGTPFGSPASFAIATDTGALLAGTDITANGSGVFVGATSTYTFAVDLAAGKAWVTVNGTTWANGGNPDAGTNPSFTWTPGSLQLGVAMQPGSNSGSLTVNLGTSSFGSLTNASSFASGFGESDSFVTSFNNKSGAVTLTNADVTTALGTTITGLTSVTSTTFVGALVGNASTATSASSATTASTASALATPRAINGVNFDGTAPITITAAAGTLTGTSLPAALTVDGTNTIGFRTIPQNSQSVGYTCVLADSGKHIFHPSADTTARTFIIPANASVAYPIGTAISFVNQNGAGVITININTDVMRLAGAGTTGSRTLAANGTATAIKITATEWIISGSGLT